MFYVQKVHVYMHVLIAYTHATGYIQFVTQICNAKRCLIFMFYVQKIKKSCST